MSELQKRNHQYFINLFRLRVSSPCVPGSHELQAVLAAPASGAAVAVVVRQLHEVGRVVAARVGVEVRHQLKPLGVVQQVLVRNSQKKGCPQSQRILDQN